MGVGAGEREGVRTSFLGSIVFLPLDLILW